MRGILKKHQVKLLLLSILVVLFLLNHQLVLLQEYIEIKEIEKHGIDEGAFREMKISQEDMSMIQEKGDKLMQYSKQKGTDLLYYMNDIGYLTYVMMKNEFDPKQMKRVSVKEAYQGILRMSYLPEFYQVYDDYDAILSDLEYFPIPETQQQGAYVTYENSWFSPRTYGGERNHEGTDLMASNDLPGYFPILSMTDGVVEKKGWLTLGGYRIGIRSRSGAYFYYAHLYSYVDGLEVGDYVYAGQLLGFMGDSGYGEEGTTGKFDTHLHFGIYVDSYDGEMSVNPYYILKILENKKLSYQIGNENTNK